VGEMAGRLWRLEMGNTIAANNPRRLGRRRSRSRAAALCFNRILFAAVSQ